MPKFRPRGGNLKDLLLESLAEERSFLTSAQVQEIVGTPLGSDPRSYNTFVNGTLRKLAEQGILDIKKNVGPRGGDGFRLKAKHRPKREPEIPRLSRLDHLLAEDGPLTNLD